MNWSCEGGSLAPTRSVIRPSREEQQVQLWLLSLRAAHTISPPPPGSLQTAAAHSQVLSPSELLTRLQNEPQSETWSPSTSWWRRQHSAVRSPDTSGKAEEQMLQNVWSHQSSLAATSITHVALSVCCSWILHLFMTRVWSN